MALSKSALPRSNRGSPAKLPYSLHIAMFLAKISQMFKKYLRKRNIFIAIFILFVFYLYWVFRYWQFPNPDYHSLSAIRLEKNISLARCSWLDAIPSNWICKDNWKKEIRNLKAQDPANPQSFLELHIGLQHDRLPGYCFETIPISFFITPSASGLTLPRLCINNDGLYYSARWNQDGYPFELIGKSIDRNLFILNLYNISNFKNTNITTNHRLTFTPSTISKQSPIIYIKGLDLCSNGKLQEDILFRLDDVSTPSAAILQQENPCIIQTNITAQSASAGIHKLSIEINGLRQWLKQDIKIAKE